MTAKIDGVRLARVKQRIGYHAEPVRDAHGYWVVGYGRRLNDKPGGPKPETYWSEQYAEDELRYRLEHAPDEVPEARTLAAMGRGGDTEIAHLTLGEIILPAALQTPEVMRALRLAAARAGISLDRFRLGMPQNSVNPNSGVAEFYSFDGSDDLGPSYDDGSDLPNEITITGTRTNPPPWVPTPINFVPPPPLPENPSPNWAVGDPNFGHLDFAPVITSLVPRNEIGTDQNIPGTYLGIPTDLATTKPGSLGNFGPNAPGTGNIGTSAPGAVNTGVGALGGAGYVAPSAPVNSTNAAGRQQPGNPKDLDYLTRMIFAEAAGQHNIPELYESLGWAAVNRIGKPGFANSLIDVIGDPVQFNSYNGALWNRAGNPDKLTGANAVAYAKAHDVAQGILSGQIKDPTGGAQFFYSGPPTSKFFSSMLLSGRFVPTEQNLYPFTMIRDTAK